MMYWYDILMMHILTLVLMMVINGKYPIMPPKDKKEWYVLGGLTLVIMIVWYGGAAAYVEWEYLLAPDETFYDSNGTICLIL